MRLELLDDRSVIIGRVVGGDDPAIILLGITPHSFRDPAPTELRHPNIGIAYHRPDYARNVRLDRSSYPNRVDIEPIP